MQSPATFETTTDFKFERALEELVLQKHTKQKIVTQKQVKRKAHTQNHLATVAPVGRGQRREGRVHVDFDFGAKFEQDLGIDNVGAHVVK